ncbi:helix-turn-helix domain-containing protein [Streptomyces luteireticuli]|uniref:helix-turn-helix domain-containing protein n=1 Tax=Streptomyces luteireticuli TaxID=173858 RepID=UPI0035567766
MRKAAEGWDFGTVVRLLRQHTGLSQAAVARLVNIDQAEVSRLERGRKKIRDRRQVKQWGEALGVPPELIGLLPHNRDSLAPAHPVDGRIRLPAGPGQLLLPAGQLLPPSALPVLTEPASGLSNDMVAVTLNRGIEEWARMPLRALIAAAHAVDGHERHFVVDASEAAPQGRALTIPVAYELDDFTYGVLWAVTGFDASLLGDDADLHKCLELSPQDLLRNGKSLAKVNGLTGGAQMFLGSQACAQFILDQRDELADDPLFWTREQRGEEAATWLFFRHKHRYLRETAPVRAHSGVGRAFCVPRWAVDTSPAYERILLFLTLALMEAYGVTTWLVDESDLQRTDGFVLVPGRKAAIATWVRTETVAQTKLTSGRQTLRTFTDITRHAQAHSVTAAGSPGERLVATAEYLGLDSGWLTRRCRQFAAGGTRRLARPRSRHLSLAALDVACSFVAAEFRSTGRVIKARSR